MIIDDDCFHTAKADFSSCSREPYTYKAKNISLYRESLSTSGLDHLESLSAKLIDKQNLCGD